MAASNGLRLETDLSSRKQTPAIELQALRNKRLIRQISAQQRVSINPQLCVQNSKLICQHIEAFLSSREFSRVLLFSSIKGEPDLSCLSHHNRHLSSQVSLALPRVQSKKIMQFYIWKAGDELFRSALGIMEPNPRCADLMIPDQNSLILVPALAIDSKGNRLGYGGGFYDRYLSTYSEATTMAVVWGDLFQEDLLPANSWDVRMQYAVTEDGIIKY